jgi:ribonuclease HI
MSNPIPVVVYFDGLCEANPGGWMAWAWVALTRDGTVVGQSSKASPPQSGNTNNLAEYLGLAGGLSWLAAGGWQGVRVRGDSQLVINQVAGTWACNAPALRESWFTCRRYVESVAPVLEWIPREKNQRADALCLAALPAEARPIVEASIARRQQLRGRR